MNQSNKLSDLLEREKRISYRFIGSGKSMKERLYDLYLYHHDKKFKDFEEFHEYYSKRKFNSEY